MKHVTPEKLRLAARCVLFDGECEECQGCDEEQIDWEEQFNRAAATIEALQASETYPVARFHETCGWEIWDECPACAKGEVFVRPCTAAEAAAAEEAAK